MIRKEHLKDGVPFMIHSDILRKLSGDQTPFQENPIIPVSGKDGLNYLETIAVKRYEDLVENFQNTVGVRNISPQHVASTAYQTVFMIDQLERPHRKKLAEMAIKYVKEDFNLSDEEILFDVEIIGLGNVQLPENMNIKAPQQENVSNKMKYELTDELHKRRFINAMTAGASKKGHYIFHLADTELNQINNGLTGLYQKMMIANDLTYYMLSDDFASAAVESGDNQNNAGFMKIEWSEDGKPIIVAKAINFPTLIHEIIKGVMEIISYLAFPDGKDEQQYIIDESDHIIGEMWDLRLGPSFWETFHSGLSTDEIKDKKLILSRLYQKDTQEFIEYFRTILARK